MVYAWGWLSVGKKLEFVLKGVEDQVAQNQQEGKILDFLLQQHWSLSSRRAIVVLVLWNVLAIYQTIVRLLISGIDQLNKGIVAKL